MKLFLILLINQFNFPYEIKPFVSPDGEYIIYARFYLGELISIDSIVPMPEYLTSGLKKRNQQLLLRELQSDLIKKGGYANKGLFGTFEIPLPKGGLSDFMGETGKLDVGGYVKITLGGTETFYSNLPPEQQRTSLLPELNMEQEMAVNLDGEVGDRMKVFIDHNSTRLDESENKIRVTYKGREDEILQELEGGDTQLSIPGTSYTGDIPSHQGLFGLKSTAKLGPVDITAIASREQTQFSEQEITGGSETVSDTIWAKDYVKRQFFWLGTNDSIIELHVYIDDGNNTNNNNGITRYAYAFLDINDDNIPDDSLEREEGHFTLKYEGADRDYLFIGRRRNIIELTFSLTNSIEALGVYYRKINSEGREDTVGYVGSDTLKLKLICPRTTQSSNFTYRYYELKNHYRIGNPVDTTIKIYHKIGNGINEDIYEGNTFISILGIDKDNNNIVDPYDGIGGYDANRGYLIFPDPMPFVNPYLPEPDSEIYTNPVYYTGTSKYFIYAKSIEVKRIFSIPFNTKRVRVYVNDVEIDSTQYIVNYDEGKLEFRRPIAPTDRIKIQAEYSELYSLAQKSLIGLRANSKIFGEGNIGSSFFFRTESYQTAPYEHIRLTEEPYSRMVWEADFALPGKVPYLTELIDNLPLLQTETESKFNINFEGAYSFSHINSRNVAYLDDFEATTINHSVSLSKNYWYLCSKPVNRDTSNFALKRIIWYNPTGNNTFQMEDIYTNPSDPNAIAEVLQMHYNPNNPQSFAGLTQYITSTNLDECENIELIVKSEGGKGRIHIDIAEEISEDQLRRNKYGELVGLGSYEDEDNSPKNFSWDAINEDRGLDGISGSDANNVNGDDGNDDYKDGDYTGGGINGTEGNRIWDTEDIDRNGIFNMSTNIYHSFSVHLDSNRFLVEGGLKNGWKMYRIPLKDSLARDTGFGIPNWQNIKFVRLWFDGFDSPVTIYMHKLNLTGSRWKNYGIVSNDSLIPVDSTEKFVITPVNTETHTYYKPPYPLPTDPLTGKTINEGGLELNLSNIKQNHTCIAFRRTEIPEDYRGYDTLVFYFRALHSNPIIALRLGSDSMNYYEYKTEYEDGILGYNNWRKFMVALTNFPELKKKTGGVGKLTEGNYTVSGNPSAGMNQFFEIQITNHFTTSLTDTMWFNDIQLTSPQYEIGRIMRSSGSLNIADLSNITFSYSESNGKFKRLSESKTISTSGPGRNFGLNTNLALDKFLPRDWGFSIPLGLSYNSNIQEPRYSSVIATDVELNEQERILEKSTSKVRGYNISLSKTGSKNWLLKQTLDNLRFSHDRTISLSNGPKNADTTELRNYRGDYSLKPNFSIKLFKQSIALLPQTISFGTSYTDNLSKSYRRDSLNQPFDTNPGYPRHQKTLNPGFSANYSPHPIISTSYTFAQTRDSVSSKWRFGEEVGRNQAFTSSISKSLIILNPSLQFNSNYNEDHRFELRSPSDRRSINNSATISISTTADIKKLIKFFTHLRDESKDTLQIPGSPLWVVKQIETFIDFLQNPNIAFSRNKSSGYYSKVRPDLKYQWGLIDTIPSEQIDPNSIASRSINDNFNIGSGVNYKILNLSGSYTKQIGRSIGYSGIENKSVSESYPNATLRISKIEQIPFLKKYSHTSSINIGFNQTYQNLYQVPPDSTPDLISDSKTLSFNPLLGWLVNWKQGITTNASLGYSETESHQYSDMFVNPSKSVSWNGSISFAYTFSAPKGISLPLLQGIKFSSNLTTNITYNYTRNTSYAASLEYPNQLDTENPVTDNETSSIDIALSYNFSTSITGGASLNYSRNEDRVFNNNYRRVSLNIWANINF